MKINFNNYAYDAFKTSFSLQEHGIFKLGISLPFVSTFFSCMFFHVARTDKDLNSYKRAAFITRGILGLIPGANLSLYLVSGLGTLATLAIDGVRAQLNKEKSQSSSNIGQ